VSRRVVKNALLDGVGGAPSKLCTYHEHPHPGLCHYLHEVDPTDNVAAQPMHACGHPLDDKLDENAKPTGEKRTPHAACRRCHRANKKKLKALGSAAWGKGRLPEGARFELIYSESEKKTRWSGKLIVPMKDGPRAFVDSSDTVMWLMIKLDHLYRVEAGDYVVKEQV
jgi:hypothetical protein